MVKSRDFCQLKRRSVCLKPLAVDVKAPLITDRGRSSLGTLSLCLYALLGAEKVAFFCLLVVYIVSMIGAPVAVTC